MRSVVNGHKLVNAPKTHGCYGTAANLVTMVSQRAKHARLKNFPLSI